MTAFSIEDDYSDTPIFREVLASMQAAVEAPRRGWLRRLVAYLLES